MISGMSSPAKLVAQMDGVGFMRGAVAERARDWACYFANGAPSHISLR